MTERSSAGLGDITGRQLLFVHRCGDEARQGSHILIMRHQLAGANTATRVDSCLRDVDTVYMVSRQRDLDPSVVRHRPGPVSVELEDLGLFRELVRDADLTLQELAHRVGCSVGHMGHIHTGRTTRISLRLARKIERELDCSGRLFNSVVTAVRDDDGQWEITAERVTA